MRQVIREEVQAETEPMKKNLQAHDEKVGRIEQKLDREVRDLAENTHEILVKLGEGERWLEIIEDTPCSDA